LLGDPPYDGIVISHEALHLAHMHHGAATWPDDIGACLIQEGVATAASRELRPGLSDSAYLWTDDQYDRWVRECREASAGRWPTRAPHGPMLHEPAGQASPHAHLAICGARGCWQSAGSGTGFQDCYQRERLDLLDQREGVGRCCG